MLTSANLYYLVLTIAIRQVRECVVPSSRSGGCVGEAEAEEECNTGQENISYTACIWCMVTLDNDDDNCDS